ncbi:GNAT family N-acetyltransferase [Syntrophomonas palmitatica]|uniref:GNAT family N-acetyltransferase n=1 Tax=Syntrophomonas palmitatica TaxID=402877 RepID=UPI0006CF86E1|nr:GNAT family N-acetyltransferase [Syntrophomonas palmitatica]
MNLSLKRLTENELELLMNWRMSDEVNRYMATSPKLTMEGQYKWFEQLKNDKTRIRWIIWADDIPIGSMYLDEIDYENSSCSGPGWFIVEKKYLDFKQLVSLHRNCCDYVFNVLGLNRLYGSVMTENKGVLQLVKLCGFEIEGERKHVEKDGVFHDWILVGLTRDQWESKKERFGFEKIDIES